jgi:hypothetical protein
MVVLIFAIYRWGHWSVVKLKIVILRAGIWTQASHRWLFVILINAS